MLRIVYVSMATATSPAFIYAASLIAKSERVPLRDHQRHPRLPAGRPIGRGEFRVVLEIAIALHSTKRENISDLRTDAGHARLKASDTAASSRTSIPFQS